MHLGRRSTTDLPGNQALNGLRLTGIWTVSLEINSVDSLRGRGALCACVVSAKVISLRVGVQHNLRDAPISFSVTL